MPFLGHVVSADGVSVDPAKTAVIQRWKPPDSVREVQSFLGFANWFRMYITGYSQKTDPLTELAKKNVPFIWSPECQNCFDWLKGCLQEPPVLALPDYQQQFEVRAVASSTGVGAVLMQGGRPLTYESAAFALAERYYFIGEQELLAVVFALREVAHILRGWRTPSADSDRSSATNLSANKGHTWAQASALVRVSVQISSGLGAYCWEE